MNTNYYYCNVLASAKNKSFLDTLQALAEEAKHQIYVLASPLVDGRYQYDDDSLMIVLSSKHKIAFVTTKAKSDSFEDLCEDIIEDIGSVSDKYGYKEKIGRPRKWKGKLTCSYSTSEIGNVGRWFNEDIALQ